MKLYEIIKKLTKTTLWFTGFLLTIQFCLGLVITIIGD